MLYFEEEANRNLLGFWEFAEIYFSSCLASSNSTDFSNLTECSYNIISQMEKTTLDFSMLEEIKTRVNESFANSTDKGKSENEILEGEKTAYYLNGVFLIPSVMINGVFYRVQSTSSLDISLNFPIESFTS